MSHTIGQVKQDNQQSNSNSSQANQDSQKPEDKISTSITSLTDADYEFLFNQLLEGISHGWHDQRIIKFFSQLGDRGKQEDWVAWLESLRVKLLKLPIASKRQLGSVMIRLGELTQSAPEVSQIGVVSNRIGRELLFGNTEDVVWEYVGSDLVADSSNVEAEKTLSERLPTDFSELASSVIEDAKTNLSSEQDVSLKQTVENEPQNPETAENLTSVSSTPNLPPESDIASEEEITNFTSNEEFEFELSSQDFDTATEDKLVEIDLATGQLNTDQLDEQQQKLFTVPELDWSLSPITQEETSGSLETVKSEVPKDNSLSVTADTNTSSPAQQKEPAPVTIDLQRVIDLIREDEELAQQISQKLNVSLLKLDNLAIEAVEQSPKVEANDFDPSSLELIESWFNLGLKQVSAGEFVKAIASWEKALNINPNLSEAWHNRGSALGRLGKYEEAIESFQNALAIDSHNYQAWNDRAHALYQLQKWSEAVESWDNAIGIMPGNHLFWYNRGCALEQLESWDQSIASYEKSLEIKPNFQPARSRYINLVADNSRSN